MKWFKFYGQDFFTDPKVMQFSESQKLIYIGLLTLAGAADTEDPSRDDRHAGVFDFVTCARVMGMVGIDPDSEYWNENLHFYDHLEELGMIKISSDHKKITITNYKKRQETYLSGAERAKKYRAKQQRDVPVTKTLRKSDERNARLDKNRLDKNIYNNGSAPPTEDAPFSLSNEIKKMEESPRREVNVIALYMEQRKPDIQTKEQFQVMFKRHLRPAKALSVFTDAQILKAVDVAKKKHSDVAWTIETLVKILTK